MTQNKWVSTTLGIVCKLSTGKTPSKKKLSSFGGDVPFVKPGDLDKEIFITQTEETLTPQGLEEAPTLPKNTVLVSCIGNLGKKAILNRLGSCNQQINAILPSSYVDFKFIYYYVDIIRPWMMKNASATTVTILNKGKFAEAPLLLPPLAEQKRIVKKIEELFGVIDEQVKRLEAAQDALISYRQSILQKIFSTLPQEKPLRSIFKTSSGGTPSRRNAEFYSGNIPWVKSGELNYNTIIDTEEHLSQTALDNSSAKLFPKGSLLIALYGATIGRLAFLGVPAATNQAVCCIFPNEQYDMQFLYYFLQHKQKYLIFQSKGGAQKNISQEILKELPIPTIDLPEQKAIVKKIETAFAFADKAQAAITDALEQAKQLKQSILKRAFEGKLVPQDPNDKPVDLTQLKKDKQK